MGKIALEITSFQAKGHLTDALVFGSALILLLAE
jgi:hypothetical protein